MYSQDSARKRVPPALRGVCLTRGPGAQLFAWQVRPPWVEWMDRVCPRATTSLPCGPGAHVFGCSPRNGGRGVRVASASRGREEGKQRDEGTESPQ